MKKLFFGFVNKLNYLRVIALFTITLMAGIRPALAQTEDDYFDGEHFGHVVNIGVGSGYFGALFVPSVYFTANYEFDVFRNFTLAPFVGFSHYRSDPYPWGSMSYYYRTTIVPVGGKATYYFDELLNASGKWDFYAAASVAYAFMHREWDYGYPATAGHLPGYRSPQVLQVHLGTEYHLSRRAGIFIDVSTGASLLGFAIHGL